LPVWTWSGRPAATCSCSGRHSDAADWTRLCAVSRLGDDTLAYGGCSAGACVCAPTLRGIELIDDAFAAGAPVFDGLGLVDFSIAPHYGADGEVGETIDRLIAHFRAAGTPYRALRDGQAIVLHDGRTRSIEYD
jgi:peptidase E